MPGIICYHNDRFFLWDKALNVPLTYAMTREVLEGIVWEREGEAGLEALPRRIDRAILGGSSSMMHASLHALIEHNRAGPGGICVPVERLLQALLAYEDPRDIPPEECLPSEAMEMVPGQP